MEIPTPDQIPATHEIRRNLQDEAEKYRPHIEQLIREIKEGLENATVGPNDKDITVYVTESLCCHPKVKNTVKAAYERKKWLLDFKGSENGKRRVVVSFII